MDSKLEQAKEWASRITAERARVLNTPLNEKAFAAAEVIQSLPGEWIDAEKVRLLLDRWTANPFLTWDECVVLNDVEALLTPPLPTLADMTSEEREACQWMRAQTWHEVGIILWVDEDTEIAQLITRANGVLERKFKDVTPLPDLPRLEWPAQAPRNPETPPAETVNNPSSDTPRNSEEIVKVIRYEKELCLSNQDFPRAMLWRSMERAASQGEWKDLLNSIRELKLPKGSGAPRNPRTEDVPAGEPWIVEHDGHEWVGTRDDSGTTNYPWALAKIDGTDYALSQDVEVALVSRLVPEHKENA